MTQTALPEWSSPRHETTTLARAQWPFVATQQVVGRSQRHSQADRQRAISLNRLRKRAPLLVALSFKQAKMSSNKWTTFCQHKGPRASALLVGPPPRPATLPHDYCLCKMAQCYALTTRPWRSTPVWDSP
ncbi:hypothetical protein MRX96_025788 [Rhipicephalus microplus]